MRTWMEVAMNGDPTALMQGRDRVNVQHHVNNNHLH